MCPRVATRGRVNGRASAGGWDFEVEGRPWPARAHAVRGRPGKTVATATNSNPASPGTDRETSMRAQRWLALCYVPKRSERPDERQLDGDLQHGSVPPGDAVTPQKRRSPAPLLWVQPINPFDQDCRFLVVPSGRQARTDHSRYPLQTARHVERGQEPVARDGRRHQLPPAREGRHARAGAGEHGARVAEPRRAARLPSTSPAMRWRVAEAPEGERWPSATTDLVPRARRRAARPAGVAAGRDGRASSRPGERPGWR
jgi:hypothetical protein